MRVTNNKAQNREGIPAQRSEELQFQPFNDERDERASENSIAEQIQDSLGKQFGESAKCISKFMPDMETLKNAEKIKNYGDFSMFPVFGGKMAADGSCSPQDFPHKK